MEAVSFKEQPWRLQTSDFFTGCDELRGLVANLLKASADHIALIPAVSYGVETAVLNLPVPAGKTVLMPEGEFPSNVYPWKSRKFVARPANQDRIAAIMPFDSSMGTCISALPARKMSAFLKFFQCIINCGFYTCPAWMLLTNLEAYWEGICFRKTQ